MQHRAATLLSRQRKRNVHAAVFVSRLASVRENHDVLPAFDFIGCGRGIAREWQRRFPQQLAGALVEDVKLLVVIGRAYEEQSARSDDRAAIVFRAGLLHSFGDEFGKLTEWNTPSVLARVEVDRIQRSPRRPDGGIAFRIDPPA